MKIKWFKHFSPLVFISIFLLHYLLFPLPSFALLTDGNNSIQDEVMDEGGGPVNGGTYAQPNSSLGQTAQGDINDGSRHILGGHTYKEESSPITTVTVTFSGQIWVENETNPDFVKQATESAYLGNINISSNSVFGQTFSCASCSSYTLTADVAAGSYANLYFSGTSNGYSIVGWDEGNIASPSASGFGNYQSISTISANTSKTVNIAVTLGSWFQVDSGDLSVASGDLQSLIPSPGYPFNLGATKSVLISKNDVSLGNDTTPSNQLFKVKSYSNAQTSLNYDHFYNLANKPTTPTLNPSGNAAPASGIYYASGNLTIDQDWNLASGMIATIFVNGDLEIDNKIIVPVTSNITFIVKGNVNISGALVDTNPANPTIEGIFLSDGSINTNFNANPSSNRLVAQGIFAAGGGFNLTRNSNGSVPSEQFTYRPDLLINIPDFLKKSAYSWQEISP
ncbi:MAG: hypothetical protein M1150_04120 [Patescibacteria group bacterium]|nr:hypothetical protein [Patescibacteria group bacterium]